MIIEGYNKVNNFFLGNSQVDKIFKGDVLVFPDEIPSGVVSKTNITTGYFDSMGNDKYGNLYICGTHTNGIYRINDEGDIIYTNIANSLFKYFFNDAAGNLYVNKLNSDEYGNYGIYKLNYDTNLFELFQENIGVIVSHIISSTSELVCKTDRYIYRFDEESNTFIQIDVLGINYSGNLMLSKKTNNIYMIGSKQQYSLASVSGIYQINLTDYSISLKLKSTFEKDVISYLTQTNDTIYINRNNHLTKYNEISNVIVNPDISDINLNIASISSTNIPYFADNIGNGLYTIDGSNKLIEVNLELSDTIRCIHNGSDGNLYFGGDKVIYKELNGSVIKMNNNIDVFMINSECMGNDKDGTLYIGSHSLGIFKVIFD